MQYTIKAVSPQIRAYTTKFGDFISYKVKFNETDDSMVIEVSQKKTSPAPQVGQVLEGTIDMSGSYGPKFKKDYGGGGFTGQRSTNSGTSGGSGYTKGTTQSDPFTMYLSYAKDLAVALVGTKEGFNQEKYDELLVAVNDGAKALYEVRPGAEPKELATPATADKTDEIDTDGFDEPIDVNQIPF